jgi:hypothetical protein
MSSFKVLVIFVRFLIKLELSRQIFENSQMPVYIKPRPVEAAFFLEGGRMERHHETNSRFSQFCQRA